MNGIKVTSVDVPRFLSYLGSKGQVFGATVRKRSDGELREFNGRFETIDAKNRLCVVNETNANGYRSMNLDGIVELRARGDTWQFDGGVPKRIWRHLTFNKSSSE